MGKVRLESGRGKSVLRWFGIAAAASALALCCLCAPDGLSKQAARTLGVLLAAIFLLIFESFNVCVSCLLACAMLFAFGCVDSISAAFSGFSNHILYFTTASFGVSLAFQKSSLSRRLIRWIIRTERLGIRQITFLFMLCGAALSAIMSNVAAVVIFIPYVEGLLAYFHDKEKQRRSRRCMMICLTVSALIGGMITPAGSSMNLICMDMLESYAGVRVRFIDWIGMGLPLAVVMLVIAFVIITRVYPPAEPDKEELRRYVAELRREERASFMDIYTGVLICGIVLTWIISSWVPAINITVTSIAGLALMFLPCFPVMTWEEFSRAISWPTFFVAGSMISVAAAVVSTGLCDYLTGLLFLNTAGRTGVLLLMQIAAVTFVFMAVLPSAPAVITILSPIILQLAAGNGVNPVMALMTAALCVSNIYLFPLDAPLVVAYDRKAFRMFELPRATLWIQLVMIPVVSLWMTWVFRAG
ncbi:MAG: SLC13 family permease [Roseburia sp.]|nr:SLC13 family permease [Roseburia sp.]